MRIVHKNPLHVLQRCEIEIAEAIYALINREVFISDPQEKMFRKSGVVCDVAVGSTIYIKVRINGQAAVSYMVNQLTMNTTSIQ